jgi:Fumarylacetoacetase N-terminal
MYAKHFSIANIPFGIASSSFHPKKSVATRLGNDIIFLDILAQHGLLSSLPETTIATFSQASRTPPTRWSFILKVRISKPSTPSPPSQNPPKLAHAQLSKPSYPPTQLHPFHNIAPPLSPQRQCISPYPLAILLISPAPKTMSSMPGKQS